MTSAGRMISPNFDRRCSITVCAMTSPSLALIGIALKNFETSVSIAVSPMLLPGCNVEIRFLYQVLRGFPKQQVFAQALLGFEVASVDPRVPGINFVMPEDGYISMTDFALQMRMVDFLHGLYPKVRITLHAGEIAPGLVTYEGLCCHVRLAVNEGHAERIGHGVDVMYENRPNDLMKELAAKHVMVEINLTSNDLILGVAGNSHPIPALSQIWRARRSLNR